MICLFWNLLLLSQHWKYLVIILLLCQNTMMKATLEELFYLAYNSRGLIVNYNSRDGWWQAAGLHLMWIKDSKQKVERTNCKVGMACGFWKLSQPLVTNFSSRATHSIPTQIVKNWGLKCSDFIEDISFKPPPYISFKKMSYLGKQN